MTKTIETNDKTIKRWLWCLGMAPIMYALFRLVCWADRLHLWHYTGGEPPTTTDYVRASVVFWGSLLIPLCVGLIMAIVAFRKQYSASWAFGEICIVGIPALVLTGGIIWPFWDTSLLGRILWYILLYANILVGGAVVMLLINTGACVKFRKWVKLALSILGVVTGMLYLFWLYAFIIYIDT